MIKIILQPSANKIAQQHFESTIKNSVNLDSITSHISGEDYNKLKSIYPNGKCFIWGVTPGGANFKKWDRIGKGDVALFSRNNSIFASGVVTFKLQSSSLSSELWGYNSKHQTWEYIYFLEEIRPQSISYYNFNKVVGYKENFIIQSFNVLSEDKSLALINYFELESETFLEPVSKEKYNQTLLRLEALEETEIDIISKRRLEQAYLKDYLFGNNITGICACCKKEYPTSFLVTAHVKKRSKCTLKEKKDVNIVMPMCKFGCDEVYEKGYISVSDGKFINLNKKPINDSILDYIDRYDGQICNYYNPKSATFFKWHIKYHSQLQ